MTSRTAAKGTVYLVGAGPGDPDLLTRRAACLIETADVIFHDDLVSAEVLALAGTEALVTSVGKRCGRPRISQQGIHQLLVEAARAGESVVRLKSGDPLVFGRAGEEIAALRRAGLPFEIVPGVTAAFAAGASLALPLTDRRYASKLIFVTAHHAAGKDNLAPIWQGTVPQDATLLVYMPGRDRARLQRSLYAAGLAQTTPCAAVSYVGTQQQQHVAGRLADLVEMPCGPSPLLIIVGAAVQELLEHWPEGICALEERMPASDRAW